MPRARIPSLRYAIALPYSLVLWLPIAAAQDATEQTLLDKMVYGVFGWLFLIIGLLIVLGILYLFLRRVTGWFGTTPHRQRDKQRPE